MAGFWLQDLTKLKRTTKLVQFIDLKVKSLFCANSHTYVYTYRFIYKHVYIQVYMYIYIYTGMYVCIYMYTYIHT